MFQSSVAATLALAVAESKNASGGFRGLSMDRGAAGAQACARHIARFQGAWAALRLFLGRTVQTARICACGRG